MSKRIRLDFNSVTGTFTQYSGSNWVDVISYTEPDNDNIIYSGTTITLNYAQSSASLIYTGFAFNGNPILQNKSSGNYTLFTFDDSLIIANQTNTASAASELTLCFLPETLIRLSDNQQKQAGDLVVGDLVATPEGPQAVKFVGKTTRNIFDLRETGRMPIRIEAGSLGDLGPDATIHCTPSHAFHIKGSLVEAQALVNGTTIQQLNDWDELMITYISIELEDHQLIWANGLLAESYYANWRSDGFSRQSWDNYDQYLELYGESKGMKELDMPRIPFARQLPAELRLLLQMNESNQVPALTH